MLPKIKVCRNGSKMSSIMCKPMPNSLMPTQKWVCNVQESRANIIKKTSMPILPMLMSVWLIFIESMGVPFNNKREYIRKWRELFKCIDS